MYKKLNLMKNFIVLITILFTTLNINAQPTVIDWYRITAQNPPLNYNPTVTTNTFKLGYYNINPSTGQQNIWNPDVGSWQPGTLFATGGGTNTTNVNYNFTNSTFTGDLDYSPEQFGAVHAPQRFVDVYSGAALTNILNYYNTQLNSQTNYPWLNWIGGNVLSTDYIDWAAWQLCVKKIYEYGARSGFGIKASGPEYYIGNRSIIFPPIDYATLNAGSPNITISGNYSKIISLGVTKPTFANAIFFRRTSNITNGSWTGGSSMQNLSYISNLTLQGTQNDIGISIGPTYGAVYQGITGQNLKTVIYLKFALRTIIENCQAMNCKNGFFVGFGDWGGSGNLTDAQSNHTTITNCRYYNTGTGDTAFAFLSVSGCVIKNCVIEANAISVGIHCNNFQVSTVKDFGIENVEFNINTPPTVGAINVRSNDMLVTISNVRSQKPAIMVRAIRQAPGINPFGSPWSPAGGNTRYRISNTSRWVGVNVGGVTKYFHDELNTNRWRFDNNEAPLFGSSNVEIQNWFITPPLGYVPNLCTIVPNVPAGCGGQTYTYYPIPR